MAKKIIIANWKMNPPTAKEAEALFEAVKVGIGDTGVEVIICPPFVYLPLLKGLSLGAQNVFYQEKGAFTGEISPLMLKDLGISYVIIGHSEARKYLNETNEMVNGKLKEMVKLQFTSIFCIGETQEERENGQTQQVIERQLTEGLQSIQGSDLDSIIIAYEPVWAIGTGNSCSVADTKKAVQDIRKMLEKLYNETVAREAKIIYGGSVNGTNAASYLREAGVDGLLVGGASLQAEEFLKIVSLA